MYTPEFKKFGELQVGTDILHFSGDDLTENLTLLSDTTAEIFFDGFGFPLTPERQLTQEDHLFIAFEEGYPVGYQTQLVFEVGADRFIYFSTAIRMNYQRKGISPRLLRSSISLYQPNIVAARSQNPAALFSAYRELTKMGKVYPFDCRYEGNQRALQALAVLTQKVAKNGGVDPNTGVQQKAYPEGKLGNYSANEKHPGVSFIRQQLSELGLNPVNGDAVFFMCVLDAPNFLGL